MFLIDANVLIRAHADYYAIDRIKPFWPWLADMAGRDRVKMPREIYDEVAKSKDLLGQWMRQPEVKRAIILDERMDGGSVARVIAEGYAPDLDDVEIEKIGRDPFLIAAAIGRPERIVATRETSAPRKQRANRKIPDVCSMFGVECIDDYELWRQLDFRITFT